MMLIDKTDLFLLMASSLMLGAVVGAMLTIGSLRPRTLPNRRRK